MKVLYHTDIHTFIGHSFLSGQVLITTDNAYPLGDGAAWNRDNSAPNALLYAVSARTPYDIWTAGDGGQYTESCVKAGAWLSYR